MTRDYCLTVWKCVYCAKQWSVCGKHMITQPKRSIFETNKYKYKSCFECLIRNNSTGYRIIPYYCRKPESKAPQSNWDKVWFEWMDFTSRYRDRTSLRLGYFRILLWFPTIGTIVLWCECVFVYYMVYENTIHVRIYKKYNQTRICWK